MGGKRKRALGRAELRGVLVAMSDEHHGGAWSPTMYDYDRWKPKEVRNAQRQMTALGLAGTAESWRRLVEELTGRPVKSVHQLQQDRVAAAKAAKAAGAKKGRQSMMDGPVARLPASAQRTALQGQTYLSVIERWREFREWNPEQMRYVTTGLYSTWEVR